MVVTAKLEVQTNEEAQVFVHDLNLFVTVHLLEETPAVLSPRLTQQGKNILCKTENVEPLVVLGLSTSSASNSSSTSTSQDL